MSKFQDLFKGMFVKLTDYEYARTRKEAVGFYLVHFLILLLFVLVIGMMTHAGAADNHSGRVLIRILGTFYCTVMAGYVVLRKRMWSWHGWALVFLAFVASFLTAVLGLGILAYLTTKPMWWPVGEPAQEPVPVPVLKKQPIKKPAEEIVKRKKPPLPPAPPRPKKERINPNLIKEEVNQGDKPDKPQP